MITNKIIVGSGSKEYAYFATKDTKFSSMSVFPDTKDALILIKDIFAKSVSISCIFHQTKLVSI